MEQLYKTGKPDPRKGFRNPSDLSINDSFDHTNECDKIIVKREYERILTEYSPDVLIGWLICSNEEFLIFLNALFIDSKEDKFVLEDHREEFLALIKFTLDLLFISEQESGLDSDVIPRMINFFIEQFENLRNFDCVKSLLDESFNVYKGVGEIDTFFVVFVLKVLNLGHPSEFEPIIKYIFESCSKKIKSLSDIGFSVVLPEIAQDKLIRATIPELLTLTFEDIPGELIDVTLLLDSCLLLIKEIKCKGDSTFDEIIVEFLHFIVPTKIGGANYLLLLEALNVYVSYFKTNNGIIKKHIIKMGEVVDDIVNSETEGNNDTKVVINYIKLLTVIICKGIDFFDRQIIRTFELCYTTAPGSFDFRSTKYIYIFTNCCLQCAKYRLIIIKNVFINGNVGVFITFLASCSGYDSINLRAQIFVCLVECFYTSHIYGGTELVVGEIMESIGLFDDPSGESGLFPKSIDLLKQIILPAEG